MQRKTIPAEVLEQLLSDKIRNRFWNKVSTGKETECWNWKACKCAPDGYGQMGLWVNQKRFTFKSHKLAWIIHNGKDVPQGKYVLHNCIGNKACCNPSHLRIGTHDDNMSDMVNQGRCGLLGVFGESHPTSKLKERDVIFIRAKIATGSKVGELAKQFGVTGPTIGAVIRRVTWRHI